MADIFDLFKKIGSSTPAPKKPVTWLIVGLGNTGKQYECTRHNAGFLALDYLASEYHITVDRLKYHSLVGEGVIADQTVLLMKPQTLMNASGTAVGEAEQFYHIAPDHVLVLSDDITQAPGKMRLRKQGSAGGHNGLKDIIAHLGSENFPRLRMGIGEKPTPEYDLADWVLSRFTEEDLKAMKAMYPTLKNGVEMILQGEFDKAVATVNGYKGQ